jgi:hypothetical protein
MIPLIKKTKKGNAGEKKNKVLTSCASRRYVAVGFLKENIIAPDLIIATATFNKHTCASTTKSTPLLQYSKFSIHRHNPELPWSRLKTTSYISFLCLLKKLLEVGPWRHSISYSLAFLSRTT